MKVYVVTIENWLDLIGTEMLLDKVFKSKESAINYIRNIDCRDYFKKYFEENYYRDGFELDDEEFEYRISEAEDVWNQDSNTRELWVDRHERHTFRIEERDFITEES